MNVPVKDPNERKTHEIKIKGNFNKIFFDSQTGNKYQDVAYGFGSIFFTGTEAELEEYESFLVKNEGKFGFKQI